MMITVKRHIFLFLALLLAATMGATLAQSPAAAQAQAPVQAQAPATKPGTVPPQSGTTEKPRPRAADPRHSGEPRPDLGAVTDGVYAEKFFNLHYTLPQGWTAQTDEMRKQVPAGQDTVLLLSAFAHPQPQGNEVNSSTTISAESAAQFEEGVDAESYLEAIRNVAAARGFKVLNEPGEIEMGGVTFLRGDFVREAADTNTYQATMVTVRKGYVLSITAISGDEEQLTPLLNRLRIIAPPALKKP